jgi:hypothetical protein
MFASTRGNAFYIVIWLAIRWRISEIILSFRDVIVFSCKLRCLLGIPYFFRPIVVFSMDLICLQSQINLFNNYGICFVF